jgi:hypothetical protein
VLENKHRYNFVDVDLVNAAIQLLDD